MPISQQDVGGNSCGACAASYVLLERNHRVLTKSDIQALYDDVKFDRSKGHDILLPVPGMVIYYDHTDPIKLAKKLQGHPYNLGTHPYLSETSPLSNVNILGILSKELTITPGDGMAQITSGDKLAIGIYSVAAYGGLHYILTKYEGGRYLIMDSNAHAPTYVPYGPLSARFSTLVDNKPVAYEYLGACIVVG